jgi:hypothetical protein
MSSAFRFSLLRLLIDVKLKAHVFEKKKRSKKKVRVRRKERFFFSEARK